VLVSLLAMFVSRFGVLLRLFVPAKVMMMGGLKMMMCGRVVMSGGLMMMLTGRCFGDFMSVLGWPASVPVQCSRDSAPYFAVSIRPDCAAFWLVLPVSSGVTGVVRMYRSHLRAKAP
jgi:hypothetical protein